MATRWIDLLDPTHDDVRRALPIELDAEVVDALSRPSGRHEARPRVESRGAYVFGVLEAMLPVTDEHRVVRQEVGLVATPDTLATVRKTPPDGPPYDPSALRAATVDGAPAGILVQRLVDDVVDTFLDLVDDTYVEIDQLEDHIDRLRPSETRLRLSELRHELLHRRRTVTATRAAVRRVLDGRVDVGAHELFPSDVERVFGDTYDTLVRVTEELDVARDLLASVRDHLQAKVAESQNEVAKKLTVIASLVLVPSFIVGFYGQNFEGVFHREYWTLATSVGLILVSTAVQLALFRWRRWI